MSTAGSASVSPLQPKVGKAEKQHKPLILQATGEWPVPIDGRTLAAHREDAGGGRGVQVSVLEADTGDLWVRMDYLTSCKGERDVTHLRVVPDRRSPDTEGVWPAAPAGPRARIDELADWVCERAARMLPPGAGGPVTPLYEANQKKLMGQLQTLALECWSKVLADLAKHWKT
jgi:hypothetical protein